MEKFKKRQDGHGSKIKDLANGFTELANKQINSY